MSAREPIDTDLLPAELRARDQWVTWGYRVRAGQTTKVPLNPNLSPLVDRPASTTDPRTWTTYIGAQGALDTYPLTYNGIGYVFSPDDPYCGIDLDSCRDPLTGDLARWARPILARLRSYSELSPSAKGIHVIVRAQLPPGARHRYTLAAGGRVEAYDQARYFAMTGHHLPWTPRTIQARQRALARLLHSLGERRKLEEFSSTSACGGARGEGGLPHASRLSPLASDDEALARIAAQPTSKLARLFAGDWRSSGYPSHSEADLALCSLLSLLITTDPQQLDRLFRHSGLYRGKWDKRRGTATYAQRTITKALS